MIGEAGPVDTSRLTAQYELLRSQVVGAQQEVPRQDTVDRPRAVGLALMLREGMPGWLRAIAAVVRESQSARASETVEVAPLQPLAGHTCAPAWLSGVPPQDLTALLTSLVLSTRSVEQASSSKGDRSWH